MHSRWTRLVVILISCLAALALVPATQLFAQRTVSQTSAPTPAAPPADAEVLRAALERAANADGYRFDATIEQTLTPRAVSGMLGEQTQHVTLWLDGERDVAESRFSVRVDGAAQAAQFVARDGALFVRKDGQLEPVRGSSNGALLPAMRMGDFMRAARDVTRLPGEAEGGVRFAFALDMRALSEQINGVVQRAPLGDAFERMSGSGEVWLSAEGRVQRQIVTLAIPEASAQYDAHVKTTMDLRDWSGVQAGSMADPVAAQPARPAAPAAAAPSSALPRSTQQALLISAALLFFALCAVLAYRIRPRLTQRALSYFLAGVFALSTPLTVAGQAVAASQDAARPSFAQAAGIAPDHASAPTSAEAVAALRGLQTPQQAGADVTACGTGQPGVDTDQDGLTDPQENCLGTDPLNDDTDGDLLGDGFEARGFLFSGRTIALNPFEADSNQDAISDGQELTATLDSLGARAAGATEYDIDGDGLPNVSDIDNDGDSVPDDIDLSPFAAGANAPELAIQVGGGAAGEYQYIEGQIQPESAAERVFGTTPLDWPDGDSAGQINDLNRSKDDLRLTPFLRVETRNVPYELRNEYGVALLEAGNADKDSVMLLPLHPVTDGGLVKGFYFKASYAPSEAAGGIQWKARVIWMLRAEIDQWSESCPSPQVSCIRSATQVLHSYNGGAFRLTGLNVVKSRDYEMAVLGTPATPNEDAHFFQALYGIGELFLKHGKLQDQAESRSALSELSDRFRPSALAMPANLRLNLPITIAVAMTRTVFAHHDAAIAGANLDLLPGFLNTHYASATDAQKCMSPAGALFQCAAVGLAYEEKLGSTTWATGKNGDAFTVNLAEVPLVTSRGLRGAMYERTATGWQMMDGARMLATVENRYQRQLAAVLSSIQQLNAAATERDVRMASYLPYLDWYSGRNVVYAVDGVAVLNDAVADEGELLQQTVPVQYNVNGVTLAEKPAVLSPLWTTEGGAIGLLSVGFIGFKGAYAFRSEIKSKIKAFANNRWKLTGKVLQAGSVAVAIAGMACSTNKGSCDERALGISTQVFRWLTVAGELAEVRAAVLSLRAFNAQRAVAQNGALATAKVASSAKALSKGAAALVIAGAALDISLAWVEYSVITKNLASDDDIGHKRALSMAIGLTIWAVIVVMVNFIPVVGPLISALLSLIDVIIMAATGGRWSLGRVMVEMFYSVNVLTEIKESSFLGGGSALANDALGFVSGNIFRIKDRYQGISAPTSDGGKGDLNDADLRGFYAIAGANQLLAPAATKEGPAHCQYMRGARGWEWNCQNDLEVEYTLPATAKRDYALKFYMKSEVGIVYEECGLWGTVCGSNKVDYRTLPEDKNLGDPITVYVDVLPDSAAALWDPALSNNLIANPDIDGDGLTDADERTFGTNPRVADSDGDGLADGFEKRQSGRTASSPTDADSDDDGLNDYEEFRRGLSSANPDGDADGLTDGAELTGWLVNLPGALQVRVFSDPTLSGADGDALTDAQEFATAQSPYGVNAGPVMGVDVAPFAASPDGSRFGAFVRPAQAVTTAFGLVNPGPVAISNNDALSVCLPQPLSGADSVHLTGDRAPVFSTGTCAGGQQAEWRFDGATTLQPFETVSGTINSVIAANSGSVATSVGIAVRYDNQVYTDSARVIVDADAPSVRLIAPADGAILRRDPAGTVFNVGGSSDDASSWVSNVALTINGAPAASFTDPAGEFVHGWALPATDGPYTLIATATDYVGQTRASAPVNVTVDGTAPSANVDLSQFTNINGRSFVRSERGGVIVLTGAASDATSGLASVHLSIDGRPYREVFSVRDPITATAVTAGAWSLTWTLPITDSAPDGDYPAQGAHTLRLRAVDRAGNISDPAPVTIVVDIAPPSSDLTTNAYVFTPTVRANVALSLTGRANDLGNLPLPSRAARLQGGLDSVYSATLWLQLENQNDSANAAITWLGDVNGDGRNDLAIGTPGSNAGAGRVSIVYGRAGDFRVPPDAEAVFATPSALAGVPGAAIGSLVSAIGDVNGDGLYDLAVGDAANSHAFIIFGRPSPLGTGQVLSTGVSGSVVALDLGGLGALRDMRSAGDVNNDGNDDVLVATANAVYLLLGQSGVWSDAMALETQAAASLAIANASASGLGDLDGDGLADFGIGAGGAVRVLRGSRTFAPRAQAPLALSGAGVMASFSSADAAPRLAALGDFNGDGKADFVLSNAGTPQLILGGATPVAYPGVLPAVSGFIAAPGDINGDGLADLLLGNSAAQSAVLVRGTRAATAAATAALTPQATIANVANAASAPYATGGDLNCDQASDVLLLPTRAPAISHAQISAHGRINLELPQTAAFDAARLPQVSTAYSSTLPAAAANVLYVGCPGCYATIQAAITAAPANARIVVAPGAYAPFVISGVAKNGLSIEGAGAGPDQVIIDGAGGAQAAEIRDVRGVSISRLALRNARVGMRVVNAGNASLGGAAVATSTIRVDSVLVHDTLSSTLDLDRISTVNVQNSTLLGVAARPVVNVDTAPDPAYVKTWDARTTQTLQAQGSLATADDGSAQPPIFALQGGTAFAGFNPATNLWTSKASAPVSVGAGSGNLVANSAGSQLFVLPSQTWNGLGRGVNGPIKAITRIGACIVVAGSFTTMTNADGTTVASNANYGLGCFNLSTNSWQAITLVANQASTINALATAGSPNALYVGGALKLSGASYGVEKCALSGSTFTCARAAASGFAVTDWPVVSAFSTVTTDPTMLFVYGTINNAAVMGCTGAGEGTQGGLFWNLTNNLSGMVRTCAAMTRRQGATSALSALWVSPSGNPVGGPGDWVWGCLNTQSSCNNPPTFTSGATRGGLPANINSVLVINDNLMIAGGNFDSAYMPMMGPPSAGGWTVYAFYPADSAFSCTTYTTPGGFGRDPICTPLTLPGAAGTPVSVFARGSGSGNIYAARGSAILQRQGDGSWTEIARFSGVATVTSINDVMVNGVPQLIVGGTFSGVEAAVASPNLMLNFAAFMTYTVASDTWANTPFPVRFGTRPLMWQNSSGTLDMVLEGTRSVFRYTPGSAALTAQSDFPNTAAVGTAIVRIGADVYATMGGTTQLYRQRAGVWTYLGAAPFTFGSGASLAYDGLGAIYALQGGGGTQFARYSISTNSWGAIDAITPNTFRIDAGGGWVRSADALYAARGNGVAGFARYSKLQPQPLKLALNNNALFAPRAATTATLTTVDGTSDDYGFAPGVNQFVDGGAGATVWTPAASAITRASTRLLNEDADVYRTGAGSTLTAGYYARRDATHAVVAYVSPSYCATCVNDGRVWGVDAFASIQFAINRGAHRVLLAPGVYVEAFQLANGTQVIGAGAETTLIRAPAGWSGPLVTADGVSQAGLSRVTLDGGARTVIGFRAGGGARDVRFTRAIVRNTNTAIALSGLATQSATDVEISNVTLVDNTRAIDQSGNALIDLRNSIVAFNGDGIRMNAAAPRLEYNLYFNNGATFGSDVNGGAPSGSGEISQDPLFVNRAAADFRLLPESPAIDAGNPGDPTPPSIGGRVDLGFVERAQAAFFADDDYGQNALNDGLTWQVDAFATIGDALGAAERYLRGLNCQSESVARDARGICDVRVIVGVGPGVYAETVRVPSYVRLLGAGAEFVTINAGGQSVAVTLNGAIRSEISGLTVINAANAGIDVSGASNSAVIERMVLRGNGAGVRVSGGAEALIRFNTVLSNTTGVEAADDNTFVQIENNVLAFNGSGIAVASLGARASSSHNLINSRVLNYGAAPDRVQNKEGDLLGLAPGFANESAGDFRLTAASPAVDSAASASKPPLGGGSVADRGYAELIAIPLTVFFGQSSAPMCIGGNAGVAAVEVGLSPVAQPALALTETLPANWQRLTFGTPVTAAYWSASVTPAAGPQRLYSRGQDALGNIEGPVTRYSDNFGRRLEQPRLNIYDGAFYGDADAPTIALISPALDTSASNAVLMLRATATGTLNNAFDVAEPFFEIGGERYAAQWTSAVGSSAREYQAAISLPDGVYVIRAAAADRAGNIGRSNPVNITISATAPRAAAGFRAIAAAGAVQHQIGVAAPVDGAWTNASNVRINGAVRFVSTQGAGIVRVQSGANSPVSADLADRFAALSPWSADAPLLEGANTISITASNDDSAATAQISVTLKRDTVQPLLTTPGSGTIATQTVEISGTVSDAHSGVSAVDVSVDGGLTWLPAVLSPGRYRMLWQAPIAEQNTSYPLRVRATDFAGNTRVQDLTVLVDNLPPGGIDPVEFNIPAGSHLDVTSTLVMTWTPATDNGGALTVTAAINQSPAALPTAVTGGTTFNGAMNADGAWYAHVSAADRAGNQLNRTYGPWHIGLGNLCYATQSIELDGVLGVDENEWRLDEFLDDDERTLVSQAPGARRERQSLYTTWDADAFYIGWRGAWWDIDGAMVAYLDVDGAAGGSTQPIGTITPTQALPFSADWAVVVAGLTDGTLYHFESGAWVARGPAQFVHSTRGDTEMRIQTPIRGLGTVRMLAYATREDGTVWSTFPTTNPLAGPWTEAYVWGAGASICDVNQPGREQPRATSLNVTLESAQAPQIMLGAGEAIDYAIRVENLESFSVTGASLVFGATAGLVYQQAVLPAGAQCADCSSGSSSWRINLPELAPGASLTLTLNSALAATLDGIHAVTSTLNSAPEALSGPSSLAHRVDSVPPTIDPAPAPAGAVQPGDRMLFGSAADDGGSGVRWVEIRRASSSAWQPVTGTLSWAASVALLPGEDAQFVVRARDLAGNLSDEKTVQLRVDATAPEITFTVPALIGGVADSNLTIDGAARDAQPADSIVTDVELQVVDPTVAEPAGWVGAFGPYPAASAGGEQPWHAVWTLPEADGVQRRFRARATDAAGNINIGDWQTATIDTLAPLITTTFALTETTADFNGVVISGTVRDGMTVVSSTLSIYAPDGEAYTETLPLDNGDWAWSPQSELITGTYRLRVRASDSAGNTRVAGPFEVVVGDAVATDISIGVDGALPATLLAPVTFTVSATGTNLSYDWRFSDGALATGAQVTHAFGAIGTYTVVVTATNGAGALSTSRTIEVVDIAARGLRLESDSPTRLGGATTLTASIAAGSNVLFDWDYGDGAVGSGAVLSHTYAAGGTYTASVVARNGVSTLSETIQIDIDDFPMTALVAGNDGPSALGQASTFTAAQSGGSGVTYDWDFGDGAHGSGMTTTHVYAAPGDYIATVSARNTEGVLTATTSLSVDVPIVDLLLEHDGPTHIGDSTHFSITAQRGSRLWVTWDFGDGVLASGLAPSHRYDTIGVYDVVVTATNSLGLVTATRTVHVHDVSIRGLLAVNSSPHTVGSTTYLTASIAAGTGVTYAWDFGDGATATGAAHAHAYAAAGAYTATVTATNDSGSISTTTRVTIWPTPAIAFTLDAFDVREQAGVAVVTVTLDTPASAPVGVGFATRDGDADATDYVAAAGTLRFEPGERAKAITIMLLNDAVHETDERFSIVLSDPVSATLAATSTVTVNIADDDPEPTNNRPDVWRLHLPAVYGASMPTSAPRGPDLIVRSAALGAGGITLVIENIGNEAVRDAFWVDLYIDPKPLPRAVNDVWSDGRSASGAVWGVTASALPLQPGAQLTLTLSSPYYQAGKSRLSAIGAGTPFAVHVDSASTLDPQFGAVRESHEPAPGTYNNIYAGRAASAYAGPSSSMVSAQHSPGNADMAPDTNTLSGRPQ